MNRLSRRATVAGLLAAAAGPAFAQRNDPPPLRSGSRQFTLLRPARVAPPLSLTTLQGKSEVVDLRGTVTLINFWAIWCPACIRELPVLEQLHRAGAQQGVRVLAISVGGDDRAKVQHYLKRLGIRHLPVYLDLDGSVAFSDRGNARKAPFGLYGMPISYVLDREARIVGYLPGEADWLSPDARRLLDYYR